MATMHTMLRWSKLEDDPEQPTLKNHTATLVDNKVYVFGGYDGNRNHSTCHIFEIETLKWRSCDHITGTPPPGRNGHTATLAGRQIYIIGGWLGAGPLAADDMHYLDVDLMRWVQPAVTGARPGPCNMHTADSVASQRRIYVFRGGDGREYLNDLHALDVDTHRWERVQHTGNVPEARANHCSAVVDDALFIFGGWNGAQRLNDVHRLDTRTMVWTRLEPRGVLPPPRAGMTFTRVGDRLYLFGGSGPAAKCFDDLQILNLNELCWTETTATTRLRQLADSRERMADSSHEGPQTGSMTSESNPNEHTAATVTIIGEGPGPRAGHTATMVDRRMLIFGGSHGRDYLGDMYVLDTDPIPVPMVTSPSCGALLSHGLGRFFPSGEFADVTFVVEGHRIPAHRLVLSLVSDRFRAMFTSGFREASEREVVISDCSHAPFRVMMEYIYSGSEPRVLRRKSIAGVTASPDDSTVSMAVDLLELADQFMLDHLKQLCEVFLKECVREETVQELAEIAERNDARQLLAVCRHYMRHQPRLL